MIVKKTMLFFYSALVCLVFSLFPYAAISSTHEKIIHVVIMSGMDDKTIPTAENHFGFQLIRNTLSKKLKGFVTSENIKLSFVPYVEKRDLGQKNCQKALEETIHKIKNSHDCSSMKELLFLFYGFSQGAATIVNYLADHAELLNDTIGIILSGFLINTVDAIEGFLKTSPSLLNSFVNSKKAYRLLPFYPWSPLAASFDPAKDHIAKNFAAIATYQCPKRVGFKNIPILVLHNEKDQLIQYKQVKGLVQEIVDWQKAIGLAYSVYLATFNVKAPFCNLDILLADKKEEILDHARLPALVLIENLDRKINFCGSHIEALNIFQQLMDEIDIQSFNCPLNKPIVEQFLNGFEDFKNAVNNFFMNVKDFLTDCPSTLNEKINSLPIASNPDSGYQLSHQAVPGFSRDEFQKRIDSAYGPKIPKGENIFQRGWHAFDALTVIAKLPLSVVGVSGLVAVLFYPVKFLMVSVKKSYSFLKDKIGLKQKSSKPDSKIENDSNRDPLPVLKEENKKTKSNGT